MVVEEAGGGSHHKERIQDTREEAMNLENKETCEMVVEEAGGGRHHQEHKQDTIERCISEEETVIELNNDGTIDASKCKENKENNDELSNGVCPENNRNVDSKESVEEVGNQEKDKLNVELDKEEFTASVDMQNNEAGLASEEGDDEMFIISEDDIREESVMGSEDAKDLEPLTDAITINEKEETINDDTNTRKEVLLVPQKKVLKRRKAVKKRKLVKGKVFVAKDEEKPQSSEMPDPSDEVRTNQDVKNKENPDGKTLDNVNNSRTVRTKKKNAQQITDKVTVKSKQSEKNKQSGKEPMASGIEDEAEPSDRQKSSNRVESMGMIFMCSSQTKEDCYHYKILGLPASKKDLVLKIYKGMRLFLFDIELKLLYGIYKAAGPGGYNIEPNAFKSNYPSQVRFTTVNDCSPLPEEKFKNVIKDNYYTKNKFHCELNSKQVKSLCKLFRVANKGSKSKAKAANERPKMRVNPVVEREKKRRARIENDDRGGERRAVVDSERDNKRRRLVDDVNHSRARGDGRPFRARGDVRHQRAKGDVKRSRVEDDIRRRRREDDARRLREDEERRLWADDEARRIRFEDDARRLRIEEERLLRIEDDVRRLRADDRRIHSPFTLNDNRYTRHADVYERETYLPSAALPAPLHLDALPAYTSSYTGRTSLVSDHRLNMAIDNEDRGLPYSSRPRNLYEYESSYFPYREPVVYRDAGYDVSSTRQSYYSPLAPRDEYLPSTSRTSRYRLSPYRRY